jgi:CHAD domain-containing protein
LTSTLTSSNEDLDRFATEFGERVSEVTKRLRKFRADPNAANIHDLRTAIRQFEAAEGVLPEKLHRSRMHREFRAGSRKAFKLTTEVRDLDVVIDRLMGEAKDDRLLRLVDDLALERAIRVRSCRAVAGSLLKAREPVVLPSSLSGRGLNKRFRKTVGRLSRLIDEELKTALGDETDEATLHRLRKHCKELRYTVEIADADRGKTSLMGVLEEFQDDLGAIHDEDTIITYLRRRRGNPSVRRVLEGELRRRHENYLSFCESYRSRLVGNSSSSPLTLKT